MRLIEGPDDALDSPEFLDEFGPITVAFYHGIAVGPGTDPDTTKCILRLVDQGTGAQVPDATPVDMEVVGIMHEGCEHLAVAGFVGDPDRPDLMYIGYITREILPPDDLRSLVEETLRDMVSVVDLLAAEIRRDKAKREALREGATS